MEQYVCVVLDLVFHYLQECHTELGTGIIFGVFGVEKSSFTTPGGNRALSLIRRRATTSCWCETLLEMVLIHRPLGLEPGALPVPAPLVHDRAIVPTRPLMIAQSIL
jgi:hypothetical protein